MSRVPLDVDATRRARYEALFREVYEPVQRYVRRRTAAHLVDDVVAEALTVAWRRLDDVPGDGLATAWCIGVARRCLANQRRGSARHGRLVERVAAAVPSGHGDDPTAVEGERRVAPIADPALDAALAQLAVDDQELLHLWAWDELAPREIATVMGLSANAVSIRLHRAKQRLAELLARTNSAGDSAGDLAGRKDPESAGHSTGGRTEEAR